MKKFKNQKQNKSKKKMKFKQELSKIEFIHLEEWKIIEVIFLKKINKNIYVESFKFSHFLSFVCFIYIQK